MFLDQSFVVLFAIETLYDFYLTSPLDLPLLRQEKMNQQISVQGLDSHKVPNISTRRQHVCLTSRSKF